MYNGERQRLAREAGHHIYNSVSGSSESRRSASPIYQSPGSVNYARYSRRMSAVRRTFCLIVTSDLIFTLIMWIIYCQVAHRTNVMERCWSQIEYYSFHTSMFDTVMLAAFRFVVLILAYALFRLAHWWPIAITTAVTSAFLISKAFLFRFSHSRIHNSGSFDYIIIISSFIIAWGETWFLDFKVIPKEMKQEKTFTLNGSPPETAPVTTSPLMNGRVPEGTSNSHFYTPIVSSDESDGDEKASNVESPADRGTPKQLSSPPSQGTSRSSTPSYHSAMEEDYLVQGNRAWDIVWNMVHTVDGWRLETGENSDTGCVYSWSEKHSRKVFMLQGCVDISPQRLFEDIVLNQESTLTWNHTVLESTTIQVIDDHTDVAYNVSNEAAGGLISTRDFVTIRHWGVREGAYLCAGTGTTHPDKPAVSKHIRGENGPGGYIFKAVEGEPDRCLFMWIINSNLKGWLPQTVIDRAMSSELLVFLKQLRKHAADLRSVLTNET